MHRKRLTMRGHEIRDEIGASDKFVLSLKTLRKLEDAEKLVKDMRNRMRKN